MNQSKAYRHAYYGTRAIFRALDVVAENLVRAADAVVDNGSRVFTTVRDIGRGVKDATTNSVLDIPQPRSRLVIDGELVRED